MAKKSKPATAPRKTVAETTRFVLDAEARQAKAAPQADPPWLADLRGRLPATWAKVSDVALALDVSCTTVREWVAAQEIVAVDYAVRSARAAWTIYVPSVLDFVRKRTGGRNQ